MTGTAVHRLCEIRNKLTTQGARGVAEEESRSTRAAAPGRRRLLEQTRREIDLELRVARREPVREAADLAVTMAGARITRSLSAGDHVRLVDRYLDQVRGGEGRR